MEFPLGTSLWVKCDDGEWWPAAVRRVGCEVLHLIDSECDTCIEFYHDPGNLYPLNPNNNSVRLLHIAEEERDEDEQRFFAAKATSEAVRRLFQGVKSVSATPAEVSRPYSNRELCCMSDLISQVSPDAASKIRNTLLEDGVKLPDQAERKTKKRKKECQPKNPRLNGLRRPRVDTGSPAPEEHSGDMLSSTGKDDSLTNPLTYTKPLPSHEKRFFAQPKVKRKPAVRFQEPLSTEALDVLRAEVFENPNRFVLSPLYRFIDLLGAVEVSEGCIETTLPSPMAVRETPAGGFSPSRRVLLAPLSGECYNHGSGWMEPFQFGDSTIAMELVVNGAKVVTPCNPSVPSGREGVAVKSSPVLDITDSVLDKELFSLQVLFTELIDDMALWEGVVVVLYVERVGVDEIAQQIVSNYHFSPANKREVDGVVDVQVRAVCPITCLPLAVPVRAAECEHLQCVELRSMLIHCCRTNVWNCPLCWAPMTPRTIAVNYRLKEWLELNKDDITRVDFVVETPPGSALRVVWKKEDFKEVDNVDAIE